MKPGSRYRSIERAEGMLDEGELGEAGAGTSPEAAYRGTV
jgi:hypothetical protein